MNNVQLICTFVFAYAKSSVSHDVAHRTSLSLRFSLCRGKSLFNLVHVRKEKFPMNKTIIIAQQVAQVNINRVVRKPGFVVSDQV